MATHAQYGRDIRCSLPHVYCRFCGKAIRLSRTFITTKVANKQNEQASVQELGSRLFPARCRSCHEEAIYTLSQILDFPD
jgi:thymidine kinase